MLIMFQYLDDWDRSSLEWEGNKGVYFRYVNSAESVGWLGGDVK